MLTATRFLVGEYFSEVCHDSISVWEDESVAFDVLLNDYVAGGIASIIESSTVRLLITNFYSMLSVVVILLLVFLWVYSCMLHPCTCHYYFVSFLIHGTISCMELSHAWYYLISYNALSSSPNNLHDIFKDGINSSWCSYPILTTTWTDEQGLS